MPDASRFVWWMPDASRQSHLEISFSLSCICSLLIPLFITSCSFKGFAFSPEKVQCTACGRVIVAGPMGLFRHLARRPLCSKDYEAQLNPHRQRVLFPSMLSCTTVSLVDDSHQQSEAGFMHTTGGSSNVNELLDFRVCYWRYSQ